MIKHKDILESHNENYKIYINDIFSAWFSFKTNFFEAKTIFVINRINLLILKTFAQKKDTFQQVFENYFGDTFLKNRLKICLENNRNFKYP